MDRQTLDRFSNELQARKRRLVDWLRNTGNHRELNLGGCSDDEVCLIDELDCALHKVEDGTFGQCASCNGEVEVERLHLDFTTQVCLEHYSEEMLRDLERDLELAAKVQSQLFPSFVPALDSIEIAAHAKPARVVGGDYYDFFPFQDDDQGIIMADVMGKGLSASMLMSNLQASLRILGPQYTAPNDLASRLNELFRYNVNVKQFISLFLVCLDKERDMLCYCNAGHNPAVMWKESTQSTTTLTPTGPAIGLVHDPDYSSLETPFSSGDVVVLYTDGLVEARNSAGVEFGIDRLKVLIGDEHTAPANELLKRIRDDADAFADGPAHDDLSVLVVKHL